MSGKAVLGTGVLREKMFVCWLVALTPGEGPATLSTFSGVLREAAAHASGEQHGVL